MTDLAVAYVPPSDWRPIAPHREPIALVRQREAQQVRRRFRDRLRAAWNDEVGVSGPVKIAVKNRDGFACVWCGADEPLHVDHVWPKVWGGADVMDNLQTLCQPCNAWKWHYAVVLVRDGGQLYAHRQSPRRGFVVLARWPTVSDAA